jgi:hypothetical protein
VIAEKSKVQREQKEAEEAKKHPKIINKGVMYTETQ